MTPQASVTSTRMTSTRSGGRGGEHVMRGTDGTDTRTGRRNLLAGTVTTNLLVVTLMLMLLVSQPVVGQITFEVQEEQSPPVLLGNIAVSANISHIPDLGFSLLSQKEVLQVSATTGEFSTRAVLDRETLCGSSPSCELTASVAVSSPPSFFRRYSVSVTVVDANDQRPRFDAGSFSKSLPESSAVNTTVQLPVAYDADSEPLFKVRNYRLEPESQSTFDLLIHASDRPDGVREFEVYLRLLRSLDKETVSSYSLVLVASDGASPGQSGRLPLEITVTDENDNPPRFGKSEYTKSVKEITEVDTTILTVLASDEDEGENGRVSYEFPNGIDRKVQEYFSIDRNSGTIVLLRSLKMEGGATFQFNVKAYDHGSPSLSSEAAVVIAVEDTVNDPPTIRISHWKTRGNSAVVSEDAVVGTEVAFVDVMDTDAGENGRTNCSATGEFFSMQPYTTPGQYTIAVALELDRESNSSHSVLVTCTDRGSPPLSSEQWLSVVVDDVNDHPPVFSSGGTYEMRVKENRGPGAFVGAVSATDRDQGDNALIHYALDASVEELFEITELDGLIYTRVKDLDREKIDRYSFNVFAFDMSETDAQTSTASVLVLVEDVNDVWPRFEKSSYSFEVSESMEPNQVIGYLNASDQDLGLGGVVEYLLVHSPLHPEPPVSVSQTDGTLTLVRPLDHEITRSYKFVVTAFDLGKPPRNSSVEIEILVLDENDNDPVIAFPSPDNLSVTLNLDVTPGHEVIKVIANDPDSGENGRLSYSLSYPNASSTDLFWMNEDTGLITLAASLTTADVRTYNIVISVHDNGVQQRATQALLLLEVVQPLQRSRPTDSNTTIVIIMVCVTLMVAVIVLVTLCFIKYVDKKKFDSDKAAPSSSSSASGKSSSSNPHKRRGYSPAGAGDSGMENGGVVSPSLEKQTFPSSSPPPVSQTFSSFQNPNIPSPQGKTSSSEHQHQHQQHPQQQQQQYQHQQQHHNQNQLQQSAGSISRHGGKKSVTFNSEVMRASDTPTPSLSSSSSPSTSPPPLALFDPLTSAAPHLPDMDTSNNVPTFSSFSAPSTSSTSPSFSPPLTSTFTPHLTSFNPPPPPTFTRGTFPNGGLPSARTPPTHSSSSASGTPSSPSSSPRVGRGEGGDVLVDVALQKHNALVRSMRGNSRRPPHASSRQGRSQPGAGRDTDLYSSSSVETSDSGHGGSELDVSVVKVNV